jgi:hypothetical protein
MRRSYSFVVKGYLPPSKNEAKSLFGTPSMVDRVIKLRLAASEALHGDPPLRRDIRLALVVHVEFPNERASGDLDNFIRGICDSLMAANPQARDYADPKFKQRGLEHIDLARPVAVEDDCGVLEINARKVALDTNSPWYEITLEGE